MTVAEFWGCGILAFGPPAVLYIVGIAHDPIRVILMMASCFFWLLSLLLSGLIWFAVVPLRDHLAFGLFVSVVIQEGFRVLLYLLLKKAERGLTQVAEGSAVLASTHRHARAFVCGFGFGIMSGAFALVNLLSEMSGPGTVGIHGEPSNFFLVSTAQTLCMILLHVAWGMIVFDGLEEKRWTLPIGVLVSHTLVSGLTLLHAEHASWLVLLVSYICLAVSSLIAFWLAGGTLRKLLQAATKCHVSEILRVPTSTALDGRDRENRSL